MTIAVDRVTLSRERSTAWAVAGFQKGGRDSNHCGQCYWHWQL